MWNESKSLMAVKLFIYKVRKNVMIHLLIAFSDYPAWKKTHTKIIQKWNVFLLYFEEDSFLFFLFMVLWGNLFPHILSFWINKNEINGEKNLTIMFGIAF